MIEQLGFHAAVNYKSADFRALLKEATPKGVDVYSDNTGPYRRRALSVECQWRIACCGVVSQYDEPARARAEGHSRLARE